MHKLFAGVVAAGLLLVGCGYGVTEVETHHAHGNTCLNPWTLEGKAPGEKCTGSNDCAEACCKCSSSGIYYIAQACIEGKCATTSDACQRAL